MAAPRGGGGSKKPLLACDNVESNPGPAGRLRSFPRLTRVFLAALWVLHLWLGGWAGGGHPYPRITVASAQSTTGSSLGRPCRGAACWDLTRGTAPTGPHICAPLGAPPPCGL